MMSLHHSYDGPSRHLPSFPTRRSSDLLTAYFGRRKFFLVCTVLFTASSFLSGIAPNLEILVLMRVFQGLGGRSEEHTSELQSLRHVVCRLLLEKKKQKRRIAIN